MRYSLGQEHWRLMGTDSYVPLRDRSMETGQVLRGITPWIDCQVPGGVALALYRAGWIEYPYYELNSLKCEWIENRWWIYRTEFKKPALVGVKYKLCFHGVDYDALIYLNGRFLGEHVGMYEEFSFDITEDFRANSSFVLQVVIKHAPDEMGQIGYTSMTHTQKSRFNYKWDFGTRLVNLGIWEDVEIVAENEYALEEVYLDSDVDDNGDGLLYCSGTVVQNVGMNTSMNVEVLVSLDGCPITGCTMAVENGTYAGTLKILDPELWYPNGYGKQPLYTVTLQLKSEEKCFDEKQLQQGIRRLRYLRNENTPEDTLPYTYEVNGERIYIKGVNVTPLDHIYGDVPQERYEVIIRAIASMNVNIIRVWGGGIIEKDIFYQLCDKYGLMVWQEFIQSSSGIDNIPSKRPEFLELLEKNARCALKKRRNHTCLSAWSGGNELMDARNVPSTFEDANIAMLKRLVEELDPRRFMYPTSASGPNEWQQRESGVSHDVHGDWKYRGNPQHYESYAVADNLFHSEFGCEGMNDVKSMCKVLSERHRKPVSMDDDDIWRFHGDWWCTYDRDTELFGKMDSLPEFITASQWIQAEAIRYILEANRRRAFHNSGSIIWQFNEPWPNVSCTSLYTYFDDAKMAYYWAKKAFSPYHVSLDYRSLNPASGSEFRGDIWVSKDWTVKASDTKVCAEVLNIRGETLYQQESDCVLGEVHSSKCMSIVFPVPEEMVYIVRVSARSGDWQDSNCYYFSTKQREVYMPYRELPEAKLELSLESCSAGRRTYTIKNVSDTAALHIHAVETTDKYLILSDESYFTLFPGESKTVNITVQPRFNFGFDEYKDVVTEDEPRIIFAQFPLRKMIYE